MNCSDKSVTVLSLFDGTGGGRIALGQNKFITTNPAINGDFSGEYYGLR